MPPCSTSGWGLGHSNGQNLNAASFRTELSLIRRDLIRRRRHRIPMSTCRSVPLSALDVFVGPKLFEP
jgi:hypothetical protein